MLAQEPETTAEKYAALKDPKKRAQRKYNGTRVIVIKEGSSIRIMGARRWVNDYAKNFPQIVEELQQLPVERTILDGELTWFLKGTDKDFFISVLTSPEKQKEYDIEARLMLFDVLFVDEDDIQQIPFDDRDEILKMIVPESMKHVDSVLTVTEDKEEYAEEQKRRRAEGLVVKDGGSPYRQGERTPEWQKLKNWKRDEAVIVGYTKSEAREFASVIIAQYDKKGKLQYVGKAAGFKNHELKTFLKRMQKAKTSKSPLTDVPSDVAREVKAWVKPEIVIEVKFLNKSRKKKFVQPDFLWERTDKKPVDCIM